MSSSIEAYLKIRSKKHCQKISITVMSDYDVTGICIITKKMKKNNKISWRLRHHIYCGVYRFLLYYGVQLNFYGVQLRSHRVAATLTRFASVVAANSSFLSGKADDLCVDSGYDDV
jgi:hypothetical protein